MFAFRSGAGSTLRAATEASSNGHLGSGQVPDHETRLSGGLAMLRRIVTGVTIGVAALTVLGATGVGCLTRPVEHSNPITKTNFVTSIPQGSIDKVDLLFDIDNSASMGDKQAYLTFAIPDLVARLVTPNCIDPNGVIMGKAALNGSCAGGASITSEFPPVHNLHIGIVSSSLGPRLGDANGGGGACPTTGAPSTLPTASGVMLDRHNDDQAHLLNRSADPTNLTNYTETPLAAATDGAGDNFLDWFPPASVNPANMNVMRTGPTPVTDAPTLQTDFQKLVVGVHQFGCGIESQLETWYRFLIQPDPYASLVVDKNKIAQWQGFDTVLLAQRADFLRPDSLVAILVLTDENDSEVDVRSLGGTGYNFMSTRFPLPPPRLAGHHPRLDRRERPGGRRPVVRRYGLYLHVHQLPAAPRHLGVPV